MKKSFLTILFSFYACCLFSQRIPFNQALKQSLNKVVLDFPNAFQSIKGEALPSELGAIQYQSQHALKGSLENKIIGYPSANKTVWSFESKLLATDNFAQFRNAYRAFYQDLNSPQLFKKDIAPKLPIWLLLKHCDKSVIFFVCKPKMMCTPIW